MRRGFARSMTGRSLGGSCCQIGIDRDVECDRYRPQEWIYCLLSYLRWRRGFRKACCGGARGLEQNRHFALQRAVWFARYTTFWDCPQAGIVFERLVLEPALRFWGFRKYPMNCRGLLTSLKNKMGCLYHTIRMRFQEPFDHLDVTWHLLPVTPHRWIRSFTWL